MSRRLSKVQIYKDRRGKWRWRLKASNGNILADSGQGYVRKFECWKGWKRLDFFCSVYITKVEYLD